MADFKSVMNTTDTVLLIGVAGAAWFVWREFNKKKEKVLSLLDTLSTAIGSGLFDLFHPDPVGETTFYMVTFPDGQRHSVPSRTVSTKGVFTLPNFYGSTRWQLLIRDRVKYAAPV